MNEYILYKIIYISSNIMCYLYHKIKCIVNQFNYKGVQTKYVPMHNNIRPNVIISHVTGKPIFLEKQ
jgi:hypothetical protein